jgi:polyisoprenoid-binding protein YceI
MKFLAVIMLLLFALPAQAKEWTIDYANSKLTFEGAQGGQPFTGSFSTYLASVDFDPRNPATAKIEVAIDMRSARTGDKQKDDALPQKEWFDSTVHQQAQLFGVKIRKIADSKFEASGKLTIKNITHDVTIPFTMTSDRDGQRVNGEVTIDRTQFDIGTGQWATDQFVAKPVKIVFSLMAYEKR